MALSSYGALTKSSGVVKINMDLNCDITDKDVLIVEDIVDSGMTLSYLKGYLEGRNPRSIKICTLLDKPTGRRTEIDADYVGFLCPDAFIVGFGLDVNQKYRNLPYITAVETE
jgi:hypoxanthine phosphoribosyltransferase